MKDTTPNHQARAMEKYYMKQIGARLRKRRQELGYSQQNIASFMEITYQQVQKWESGVNRISSPQLKLLCAYLDVSSGYFIDTHPTTHGSLCFEEADMIETYRNLPRTWKEHFLAVLKLLKKE